MYHDLPPSASFWSFLLTVDEDLAEETRKQGCPCGGRLHSANYQRKPRRTPSCPTRWSTPSSAVIRRAMVGRSCCGFSRPSRLLGAYKSRSLSDRIRSAEDALRPRFLVGENGLSQSFHPICQEA